MCSLATYGPGGNSCSYGIIALAVVLGYWRLLISVGRAEEDNKGRLGPGEVQKLWGVHVHPRPQHSYVSPLTPGVIFSIRIELTQQSSITVQGRKESSKMQCSKMRGILAREQG